MKAMKKTRNEPGLGSRRQELPGLVARNEIINPRPANSPSFYWIRVIVAAKMHKIFYQVTKLTLRTVPQDIPTKLQILLCVVEANNIHKRLIGRAIGRIRMLYVDRV